MKPVYLQLAGIIIEVAFLDRCLTHCNVIMLLFYFAWWHPFLFTVAGGADLLAEMSTITSHYVNVVENLFSI